MDNKNTVIQKLLQIISLYQQYTNEDEELLLMITQITNKIEIKLLNDIVEKLRDAHQKDNIYDSIAKLKL